MKSNNVMGSYLSVQWPLVPSLYKEILCELGYKTVFSLGSAVKLAVSLKNQYFEIRENEYELLHT